MQWTRRRLIVYPVLCVAGGLLAAMLGIGGGMLLLPLMLELNMIPVAAIATSSLLIVRIFVSLYVILHVTACHYMSLCATGCYCVSLYVPVCNCMSLIGV